MPASTLNVVCGSGLRAVHLAAQAIQCDEADIVVAGGQESMSQSAHYMQLRNGQKWVMHNWWIAWWLMV